MQTKVKTLADRKTIRTFIAIKIEPEAELLDKWEKLRNSLSDEEIKWVNQNNLHLTLRFLGETTRYQVQELKNLLEELSSEFSPFQFYLKDIGYFQSNRKPKVIFVNSTNTNALEELASAINYQVEKAGFVKERRSYKPHLTLGRIKYINNQKRFYQLIENNKKSICQKVIVSGFVLYESILKPTGPIYKSLQTFKLLNR